LKVIEGCAGAPVGLGQFAFFVRTSARKRTVSDVNPPTQKADTDDNPSRAKPVSDDNPCHQKTDTDDNPPAQKTDTDDNPKIDIEEESESKKMKASRGRIFEEDIAANAAEERFASFGQEETGNKVHRGEDYRPGGNHPWKDYDD
jgi:hypothetical protein